MKKHYNEPVPLLSSVNPEIGSFFDEILIKALAKKPSDRYKNMQEFVEAI